MKKKQGVTLIIWNESSSKFRFAVFKRELNWEGWELAKGKTENSESKKETAIREAKEEAGLSSKDIKSIEPLDYNYSWQYKDEGEKIKRENDCFLIEVRKDTELDINQNPDPEHSQAFFLNPRDTKDILAYENQKKAIEQAEEKIKQSDSIN